MDDVTCGTGSSDVNAISEGVDILTVIDPIAGNVLQVCWRYPCNVCGRGGSRGHRNAREDRGYVQLSQRKTNIEY